MTALVENIRKVMGWCPNATPVMRKSMQHVDFVNPSQIPAGRLNVENVQSKNIMFSANTTLFTLCFITCLNMVLFLAQKIDYATLIPILVVMYSLLYFIVAKIFRASISIDENGVHLKSFEFRDITLDYRDIKSVNPDKLIKHSAALIAVVIMVLSALVIFSVVLGEWELIITISPLLPGYLFLKHKQDREYHDLNTQLYIQAENKSRYTRWFELTSHYSIITDKMTASEILAAIEHYMGAQ